jgi:hypothetical protein
MVLFAIEMAALISVFLAEHNTELLVVDFWSSMFFFGILLFWISLAVRGLFPPERKRNVRRGYRSKRV